MRGKANLTERVLCELFLLGAVCTAAVGDVIYVDVDANGLNDGSSWENAFTFLQDALADANDSEKPVEIRVAQGIYKPDRGANQTPGDRRATFQLINSVALRGAYAGLGETDPNARDIERYETVLSGDLADNDLPIEDPYGLNKDPSRADNSFQVITVAAADPNTLLEGIFVTRAYAEEPGLGAGLCAGDNTSITLRSCVFTANASPGIRSSGSNCIIENCIFRNNTVSGVGGGICICGGSAHVIRCTFKDNWATDGGGLYNEGGRLCLEDCTFTSNAATGLDVGDAGYGGGICSEWNPAGSKIENCLFIGNIASSGGGAHFGYRAMAVPLSRGNKALLTGCTFMRNQASQGGGSSGDFRGHKFTLWEGGIRIPCIVSWPGRIPQNAVRNQVAASIDWMPTIAQYCNIRPHEPKFDGKSIVPVIESADAPTPHEILHWETGKHWAIREGDWKLVHNGPATDYKGRRIPQVEDFLSNMGGDVTETKNLASAHPEIVKRLTRLHDQWLEEARRL